MDENHNPKRQRWRLRRRIVLGFITAGLLTLVLLGIVTTVLEHERNSLDLGADGLRRLGTLVVNRDAADGSVSWNRFALGRAMPENMVVLVHGLDEPGSIWDDLTPALLDEGHAVARFEYPNDQSIALSAELLSQQMQLLHEGGVQRIAFVCHSMGGLVARDMLTRESFYAGDRDAYPEVSRLITVGTPNHGSPLAPLQPISELRELLVRWAVSFGDARVLGTSQGPAQAAKDLAPNSDYLLDLNARQLPPGVAITICAGRVVPIDVEDAQGVVEDSALRNLLPSQEMGVIFEQLDALVGGVGDGVVPLDSALLAGVDDVVILEANHRSMLKKSAIEHVAREALNAQMKDTPAIAIIVDRLDRTPPSDNE